jgi:hypothetical protein
LPRRQEAFVARDDEAALARLYVDDQPQELLRPSQLDARVARQLPRVALLEVLLQDRCEDAADEHRENDAGKERAPHQAATRHAEERCHRTGRHGARLNGQHYIAVSLHPQRRAANRSRQ